MALLDELGQAPLVVAGEQVDLADLAQVHAHAVGRRAVATRRRLAHPAPPASAEQVLVGRHRRASRAARRCAAVGVSSSSASSLAVDRLVERDAFLGQRVLHRVEDVAGQLDVTQDMGDLLGVDAAGLPPPLEQRLPLGGVDALQLGRLDGVRMVLGVVLDGGRARLIDDWAHWVIVTVPGGRAAPSDDVANLATTPQPRAAGIGSASSSSRTRASASSRTASGSPVRGDWRSSRRTAAAIRLRASTVGVDVEVGDRRPLEHLAGLGVGLLDRRHGRCRARRRGRGTPAGGRRRRTAPRPATRRSTPSPGRARRWRRTRRSPAPASAAAGATATVGRRDRCSARRTRSLTGSPTSAATCPA